MTEPEVLQQHTQSYLHHSKACAEQLRHVWEDLEMPREDQTRELRDVTNSAQRVWSEAVQFAEDKRAALHDKISNSLNEIDRIREQLGEQHSFSHSDEGLQCSPSASLMNRYQVIQSQAEHWRQRKAQRLQEFTSLQDEIASLKTRFGQPLSQPKRLGTKANDMSQAGLQILQLELDNLHAERAQRERKLDMLLGRLRKACVELDEDDSAAAAAAHPSLQHHRDHLPGHSYTYKSPAKREAAAAAVDLSNATFTALEDQIEGLHEIQEYREQRAEELMGVLSSLWEALEVEKEDVDRGIFVRLMSGPARLHGKSIQKCMAEVGRLESCKAEVMRRLIKDKWSDVEAVCAASHLVTPTIPAMYDAAISTDRVPNGGQVSEVLAKVVRTQAEVVDLAEKRAEVLSCIEEFEAVRAECRWLNEYEHDEMRYKGRDANRKLQRSIKAGKQRERMPSLVEQLRQVLTHWQMEHRQPFTYDGWDYKGVLDLVAAELEQEEELRAQHARDKKQAATMSASKKPPNSASKLRPSLLGGGSSTKGDKTPSRGPMLRMPWGARTPKRNAADSAADHLGVERSSQSMAVHGSGHSMMVHGSGPSMSVAHAGSGVNMVGPLQDKLNRLLSNANSPAKSSGHGSLIAAGRYDNLSASLSQSVKGRVPNTPYNTPAHQLKTSSAQSPLHITDENMAFHEQRPLGSWLRADAPMASPSASSSRSVNAMSPMSGGKYSHTARADTGKNRPSAAHATENDLQESSVTEMSGHHTPSSQGSQAASSREDPS
ncbi:hypothetical protein ABBQ38_010177 [Trebouxia sp. C0009 RCD-2024]